MNHPADHREELLGRNTFLFETPFCDQDYYGLDSIGWLNISAKALGSWSTNCLNTIFESDLIQPCNGGRQSKPHSSVWVSVTFCSEVLNEPMQEVRRSRWSMVTTPDNQKVPGGEWLYIVKNANEKGIWDLEIGFKARTRGRGRRWIITTEEVFRRWLLMLTCSPRADKLVNICYDFTLDISINWYVINRFSI